MSITWTEDRIGPALPVRRYGEPAHGPALVLHLHGGAFSGTVGDGEAVSAALAQAGAEVISADYPAGPAHPFPEALDAAYAALLQLGSTAPRTPLFVAGEEAGGNLAAALALMCRDRLQPKLAGQILLSPMLDPRLATCSLRSADAGPVGCRWADGWHSYLRAPGVASHPYAAPGLALRLIGVAPALVVTGPGDPMQDEADAYAARLREGRVAVTQHRIRSGPSWPCALAQTRDERPSWAAELTEAAAQFIQATAGSARKHSRNEAP